MKIEEKIDMYLTEGPHSLSGGNKIFTTKFKDIRKFKFWEHLNFPDKGSEGQFRISDELTIYDDGGVDDATGREVFNPDELEPNALKEWKSFLNKLARKSGGWEKI